MISQRTGGSQPESGGKGPEQVGHPPRNRKESVPKGLNSGALAGQIPCLQPDMHMQKGPEPEKEKGGHPGRTKVNPGTSDRARRPSRTDLGNPFRPMSSLSGPRDSAQASIQ